MFLLKIMGTCYQRDFPPKGQHPSIITSTLSKEEEVSLAENKDGDIANNSFKSRLDVEKKSWRTSQTFF